MIQTKKAKRYRWLVRALMPLAIVALCNLSGPSDFFELWIDYNHYKYSNGDGSWRITENLFMNDRFHFRRSLNTQKFLERYPGADTIVYRNFTKNPLAFWRYGKYFFDRRYTLPYISRKQAMENGRLKQGDKP